MLDFVTVILAAGKGTRMKSKLPKVLHRAAGKAMLQKRLFDCRSTDKFSAIILVYLFALPASTTSLHSAVAMRPVCFLDKIKILHQSDGLHFISNSLFSAEFFC